jgi:peptidoglycan hydrolase-like protein with peptidoglycan-binding domain
MRNFRPAFLVLLTTSLAGLGVPAGFAQSKTSNSGKTAHGDAAASKSSSGKTAAKKKSATTALNGTSHHATTPHSASMQPKGKSSGKSSPRSASSKKSRKQPGQKAPTSDRVIEIQSALAKDGSYQGAPNGKWDDDTASAMRKFQSAHGLNPNGKLDAPTLQRLGLGSPTAGVAAPTPPPGASSRLTSSASNPVGNSDSPRQQ